MYPNPKGLLILALILGAFLAPVFGENSNDEFDEFDSAPTKHDASVSESQTSRAATSMHDDDMQDTFDEDEFLVESGRPSAESTFKVKEVSLPATNRNPEQIQMINLPQTFYLEGAFVLFMVLYGLNWWRGKRQNENIVRAWAQAHRQFFEQQFARVGSDGALLIKESANSFRMSCTGRVNVQGMQLNLRLRKRHDLPSLIYDIFYGAEDQLDVTVVMNEDMPPIVMAAALNSQIRELRSQNKDVDALTKSIEYQALNPARFTVAAESKAVPPMLLSDDVCKALEKHSSLFRFFHITDLWTENKDFRKVLRFRFKIPEKTTAETEESMTILLKIVLYLADVAAEKVHLTTAAKEKAAKARAKFLAEETKQRQQELEEAQEQRRAEKRKQLEEKMKTMSPEEREKLERKLEKKEIKKRQQRIKTLRG